MSLIKAPFVSEDSFLIIYGVVSIVTCANNEAHVVNTWNSYLIIVEGNKILIPAAAMIKTEENVNVNVNPKVKLTLGSKEATNIRELDF